jgi:hypothetical protein
LTLPPNLYLGLLPFQILTCSFVAVLAGCSPFLLAEALVTSVGYRLGGSCISVDVQPRLIPN